MCARFGWGHHFTWVIGQSVVVFFHLGRGLSQAQSIQITRHDGLLGVFNTLADPAVGFGGGQLGEVTQARVPPKLKTPRIWPTIFWE